MATHWYFKAFNSIKDPHEFDFAELELSSLFGKVRKVRNFADEIAMTASPLAQFTTDDVRIQDALLYEPSYGQLQGFYGVEQIFNAEKVGRLVRRLAYTKEVYVITETTETPTSLLRQVFPSRAVDAIEKTSRGYRKSDSVLLRLVTDEYYLEKSQYVSKLSRDEKETSNNLDILLKYPFEELYRIPASSTLQVGKRLQDYFAIREESSLYLTHIWHPYKAKFHAKMSRALLNYICPNDNALVMDNWAGSGTLNVEATLMGLDNIGLEINPLSVLMADVKASILAEDARNVKDMIAKFLSELELRLSKASSAAAETTLLEFGDASSGEVTISKKVSEMGGQVIGIQSELKGLFTQEQIQEFIIARDLIRQRYTGLTQEFLLLALSGSISDLARRRKGKLFEVITLRLYHLMYARLW